MTIREEPPLSRLRHGKAGLDVAFGPHLGGNELRRSIEEGTYEWREALNARKLIRADDSVLELGFGLGLVSAVVARARLPARYEAFDADARVARAACETHRLNGLSGVTFHTGMVTSDAPEITRGQTDFTLARNFWGSSSHRPNLEGTVVTVPVRSLADCLADYGTTILLADIEGGELALLRGADLSALRALCLEIHPKFIGPAGVRELFAIVHAQGLTYDAALSQGPVVVFAR